MNSVMPKLALKIHGMDCAEELAVLKREIGPMVGGADNLTFDLLRGKMTVAGGVSIAATDLMKAVNRTGMKADLWTENSAGEGEASFWMRQGRTMMMALSGAFTLAGFLAHVLTTGSLDAAFGSEGLGITHAVPLVARLCYTFAIISGGLFVVPKALLAARRIRPDMNLLMTMAVIGALIIGEWLEASLVAFLFALSLAIESWSIGRARRAVETLLELAPSTVRVKDKDREVEVPAESLAIGTEFLVKPGDRIPLDGEVLSGSSNVNQAPITGESVPVLKEPRSQVFAGSINGDGAMTVRSTKAAGDTTLARIIQMVGAAQEKRAPSEQWVEKFAGYYTPVVFLAATLVFLIPPLLFSGSWQDWTYRALVLLVIGCPCALVISTPVSIVAALAAAARNGVLIKGGIYIEGPANLKAIAMDKTGTLTEGRPQVAKVLPETGTSEQELLEITASMESQSDHPLARAIMDNCYEKGITSRPVSNFTAIPGMGATCTISGRNYWLGSHRYLEERKEETPELHERLEQLSADGHSVVVIGNEHEVIGMIALADAVRPASLRLVKDLRIAGIEHIVMLTGDNRPTADAIARSVGIDEVFAELLPQGKVDAIQRLVEKYKHVAMIGDGVNDAPAMALASIGIAMGAAGSDAAIETADIALMSDDLSKLPWLIGHSKRTLSIIRQNITLSLVVKAIFVVLTFAGSASLWAAIAADMGVYLLVIFNALRLLRDHSLNHIASNN